MAVGLKGDKVLAVEIGGCKGGFFVVDIESTVEGEGARVGVVKGLVSVVGVTKDVDGDMVGHFEDCRVCSSEHDVVRTLGGISPFFTLTSTEAKMVGQEAFMPTGLLPMARAFAFCKHQF